MLLYTHPSWCKEQTFRRKDFCEIQMGNNKAGLCLEEHGEGCVGGGDENDLVMTLAMMVPMISIVFLPMLMVS